MGNLWRGSLQVKPSDFVLNTFYGFASTDRTETSYIFRYAEPILATSTQKVEIWFKPADGKELYHVQSATFGVG